MDKHDHTLRRRTLLCASLASAMLPAGGAYAQSGGGSFPSRPLRLLVGVSAGGTMDMSARLLSQYMTETLGQPVVVENRTGAAGVISMQQLVRSSPDGYTLGWVGNSLASISPYLYKSPGYDMKTMTLIGQAAVSSFAIFASLEAPFKDFKGLLEYGRANPGKLLFGSSGTFSSLHLMGEMLNVEANIDARHVPFRGSADTVAALLAGTVHYTFDGMAANLPLVRSGRLRAVAVTTAKRQPTLPDVPTLTELGYPSLTTELFYGLVAPPGVPRDVQEKLVQAMKSALEIPQLREAYAKAGFDVLSPSPQAFREVVDREAQRVQALMKAKNITPQE